MNGDGFRNTAIDAKAIKNSSKSKFALSSSSSASSSCVCDTAYSSFACGGAQTMHYLTTRGVCASRRCEKLTSSMEIVVFSMPMSSKKNKNSSKEMSTLENLGGAISCKVMRVTMGCSR